MCGRFALSAKTKDIEHLLPALRVTEEIKPRFNIAPGQSILAVSGDNPSETVNFRWGLIPSWAKDESIGYKMINARADTISEKPSFKNAFQKRRCIIFASGFYEWKKLSGKQPSIPFYIFRKNGSPFLFAGLWEKWKSQGGEIINSATIITTDANDLMLKIHHRMPVILNPDSAVSWLEQNQNDLSLLQSLLKPFDYEMMDLYEVSTKVNSPKYDEVDCMQPINN